MGHSEYVPVDDNPDETIQDVFNSLTEKQKKVVYYLLAKVRENTLKERNNGYSDR